MTLAARPLFIVLSQHSVGLVQAMTIETSDQNSQTIKNIRNSLSLGTLSFAVFYWEADRVCCRCLVVEAAPG